jgi:hypothetical protein
MGIFFFCGVTPCLPAMDKGFVFYQLSTDNKENCITGRNCDAAGGFRKTKGRVLWSRILSI